MICNISVSRPQSKHNNSLQTIQYIMNRKQSNEAERLISPFRGDFSSHAHIIQCAQNNHAVHNWTRSVNGQHRRKMEKKMSNLKTKVKKKEMPANPLEMIFLEINRKNIIFVYNRVK